MSDLLTNEERAQAAADGWGLYYLFDLSKRKWMLAVLPVEPGPSFDAPGLARHIFQRAKARDALCIKVLQLIAHFKAPKHAKASAR